jgi:hypothetical protein
MPRLVLHAGDCKSGSTAIQSVLQLGSWRYTGDTPPTLLYAKGGRRDGLNHHRLSDSLHMEQAQSYRDQAWGRLGAEFAAATQDLVVVSSERFEFAPPQAVADAIDRFLPGARADMQVVIYVRPHAARLQSGYAQNIRQGLFTGDLAGFLESAEAERRFHYADRLSAWKSVFGDALTVRPMVRADLTGGCVVQDFLTLCAADTGAVPLVEKIPNENKSLNAAGLALIRELHGALRVRNPAQDPARAAILQRLCTQLEALPAFGEGRTGLPMDLRPKLRDAFAEDAARCDREMFGGRVLAPALEAALADDTPLPPAPQPEDTARLRDLSLVWLEMMGQMRQQMAQAAQSGSRAGGQGGGQGKRH